MAKLIHRVGIWAALTFVTHAAITCNVLAQTNQDTKATTSQGIEELPSVTGSNQIALINWTFYKTRYSTSQGQLYSRLSGVH